MSDVVATPAVDTKRTQSEALLADVFKLMDYPAKLEFKDMSDGSLGVAVHFDGELPGITPGKRSYLVDCVQFWLNKVVNRPNVPRRWVNLGINAFPEARMPGQPREAAPQAPASAPASAPAAGAAAPVSAPAPKQQQQGKRERENPKDAKPRPSTPAQPVAQAPKRGRETDERTLTPAADPALSAAGKLLAEKSAKLGRVYGVMGLTADQRALMLKAAEGVKGVTGKAEGEGHWRRLVMVPEKLTVILKKQVMPDYDDEEEDE
jgi:predicted RNA-binding protein Jag